MAQLQSQGWRDFLNLERNGHTVVRRGKWTPRDGLRSCFLDVPCLKQSAVNHTHLSPVREKKDSRTN